MIRILPTGAWEVSFLYWDEQGYEWELGFTLDEWLALVAESGVMGDLNGPAMLYLRLKQLAEGVVADHDALQSPAG